MDKFVLYKKLPETPGVYIMKNATGDILYVGKAGNLRRRVSSYFLRPHDARIESLVASIASIEHTVTDTEIEALVLEAALIKRYMPPYNIKEKDDKSFLYVVITKDKFPRVLLVRGKERSSVEGDAYGPFVSASALRAALRVIRKIFPWSDHTHEGVVGGKPCFNAQIGLCPGVCAGLITKADYAKNIRNLKLFLKGEKQKIMRLLEADMARSARAEQFERAEAIKRRIFALGHIQETALIGKGEEDENAGFLGRIEGYDISNISGTDAAGAMVVFTDGVPDKAEYRSFNIKTLTGSNDVGMMREVLERRFENKTWPLPHGILVDGGLGQVNMAREVVHALGLAIPVVGIAKGRDRKNNIFVGTMPQCATKALLIKVRDEAHRFSRARHIRRRAKSFLK
jgi:excinuclease ABC subunit C